MTTSSFQMADDRKLVFRAGPKMKHHMGTKNSCGLSSDGATFRVHTPQGTLRSIFLPWLLGVEVICLGIILLDRHSHIWLDRSLTALHFSSPGGRRTWTQTS